MCSGSLDLYCRAEMYADRVTCCPLVSHGVYGDGTDRQTDGRTPDSYIFPLDAASAKSPQAKQKM